MRYQQRSNLPYGFRVMGCIGTMDVSEVCSLVIKSGYSAEILLLG